VLHAALPTPPKQNDVLLPQFLTWKWAKVNAIAAIVTHSCSTIFNHVRTA
jgi:hypothetical protein